MLNLNNRYSEDEIIKFFDILENIVRNKDEGSCVVNESVLTIKINVMPLDVYKSLKKYNEEDDKNDR